jgi:hypothetical protein
MWSDCPAFVVTIIDNKIKGVIEKSNEQDSKLEKKIDSIDHKLDRLKDRFDKR